MSVMFADVESRGIRLLTTEEISFVHGGVDWPAVGWATLTVVGTTLGVAAAVASGPVGWAVLAGAAGYGSAGLQFYLAFTADSTGS